MAMTIMTHRIWIIENYYLILRVGKSDWLSNKEGAEMNVRSQTESVEINLSMLSHLIVDTTTQNI